MLQMRRVLLAGLFVFAFCVAASIGRLQLVPAQTVDGPAGETESEETEAGSSEESGETPVDPLAAADFFESRVRPVLIRSCVECHGESMQRSNLRIDSAAGFSQGGDSGPLIDRDDLPSSLLLQVLTHESDLKMPPPPKAKLSESEIADIRTWVEMGAVWPPDMEKSADQLARDAKWAEHWAFRPIREQAVPQVKNRDWVKSPIDAFIVSKLEAAGLSPSPAADRQTLLRRLSYDLHGLPPSAEEIEAAHADPSSDWFENAVERMLRSPRYGERWGRHWLDYARYSDTRGSAREEVQERLPFAWSYRDWVIEAFNRDMPYDRFLILQIAADHAAATDDASDVRDLTALGFLTLNKIDDGEPAEIDDRLDTLFRTTMGLSVSCARCHDHKYDPIPTADYYSLYGVFQGATRQDVPIIASMRDQFALRRYEEELQRLSDPLDGLIQSYIERQTADARAHFARLLLATKVPTTEFDGNTPLREWIDRFAEWSEAGSDSFDPVWTPWREMGGLSDVDFKKQAAKLARKYRANKFDGPEQKLNKRVAAMFQTVPKSPVDLADRYTKLFFKVEQAWKDLVAESEKKGAEFPEQLPDEADDAIRELLEGDNSPLALSVERVKRNLGNFTFDDATGNAVRALMEHVDAWKSSPNAPRHAMTLQDPENIEAVHIFKGGTPFNNGAEVPRRFLTYFAGPDARPFENGTGRHELAQAIVNSNNPLTARVMVNRVWMLHFGEGLVQTPSDFGVRSDPPSHPELLDYLAHRFMAEGWSIKKLHRWILASHAWRQTSRSNDAGAAVDPENRLLWRANRRRLDFESIRDSLLSASGELELKVGGPPQPLFGHNPTLRRAVYGHIDRNAIPEPMRAFDFANPNMHSPRRHESIVAQQSLFLLNSSFVADRARNLVARLGVSPGDSNAGIDQLFQAVLKRSPDGDERAAAAAFLSAAPQAQTDAGVDEFNAWSHGRGEFSESTRQVGAFIPLSYFQHDERIYRAGPLFPDPRLGFIHLNPRGGFPGPRGKQAVIRRWTAPRSGTVDISGELSLESDGSEGILGVIAVRQAAVASWKLASVDSENPLPRNVDTVQKSIPVQAGDTIDFLVDPLSDSDNDGFVWPVTITYQEPDSGRAKHAWSSEADFSGPPGDGSLPLTPWEQLAQVLMLSNEFLFVD
jgi:cytochrome c553